MMTQHNPTLLFQEQSIDQHPDPYLYGVTKTQLGPALLISRSGYLLGLGFTDALDSLRRKSWPKALWQSDNAMASNLWTKIVKGEDIQITLLGTPFQKKVWSALTHIEKGKTVTYKDLAIAVNLPKAARAVGNAVGANPISYLIPCHRVIRSDNTLGGYRWGCDIKEEILRQEKN